MTYDLSFVALNFFMLTLAVILHQGIRRAASGLLGQSMLGSASFLHVAITGIASLAGVVAFFGALVLPFFRFEVLLAAAIAAGTFVGGSVIAAVIVLPWHRRGSSFYEAWYGGAGILISIALLAAIGGVGWLAFITNWRAF